MQKGKYIAEPVGELVNPATVAQDSPRLKWMKSYGLEITPCVGHLYGQFRCSGGTISAVCPTEDDAIVRWALLKGVRLWNEV